MTKYLAYSIQKIATFLLSFCITIISLKVEEYSSCWVICCKTGGPHLSCILLQTWGTLSSPDFPNQIQRRKICCCAAFYPGLQTTLSSIRRRTWKFQWWCLSWGTPLPDKTSFWIRDWWIYVDIFMKPTLVKLSKMLHTQWRGIQRFQPKPN